jgi:putative flippase GtrA
VAYGSEEFACRKRQATAGGSRVTSGALEAASRPAAGLGSPAARRELRRAVKYGVVGVSNVTIDFAIYAFLVGLGVWYPLAKVVSLVIATANGYTFNRLWTFRAGGHRADVLVRYVTVQALCLAANLTLLALLIEWAGLGKVVAQAVALPVVALASFLAQRLWTFGPLVDGRSGVDR